MDKAFKKYKSIIMLSAVFIILIITLMYLYNSYIIFVKTIEHGVLANKTDLGEKYRYDIYINGELKTFTTRNKSINLSKRIVNFKSRNGVIVKVLEYPEPLKEKIMARSNSSIELEYSGDIELSKTLSVYTESETGVSPDTINAIIVGTKNVSLYKDKKGHGKTLVVEGKITPSFIRVGIKNQGFQSLNHDSFEFKSSDTLIIEDKRADRAITIPPGTSAALYPDKDGILIKCGNISDVFKNRVYVYPTEENSLINVLSYERGYGLPSYRGYFEVVKSGSKLNIINEVDLENYLYQVVPSEMPSSFGLEALKAQAVAARTYALSDLYSGRYAASGFHVDDSTMSQVYNNIEENPLTTQAIDETRGLIMTYNNELVDAKYCSTSHGYGANSGDIWPTNGKLPGVNKPYLTVGNYLINQEQYDLSKEEDAEIFFKDWSLKSYDSNSPYFRWKVTFTGEELKNTIEKNLPIVYKGQENFILTLVNGKFESRDIPQNCLGTLTDIKVVKRGEGGNIMELVVSGTNGTYKIIKELNVRYVLRPRKSDTGTDNDIIIKRIKGGDLKNSSMIPSAFMVIDTIKDGTGKIESATFYGGGYGHSVGMSQYGAGYLSSQGYSFDEILGVYYKGIDIKSIY